MVIISGRYLGNLGDGLHGADSEVRALLVVISICWVCLKRGVGLGQPKRDYGCLLGTVRLYSGLLAVLGGGSMSTREYESPGSP